MSSENDGISFYAEYFTKCLTEINVKSNMKLYNGIYETKKPINTGEKLYMKFVFSCQGDYQNIALREILSINAPLKFIKWIDSGVGLLEYQDTASFADVSRAIRKNRLIFARHIFPAEYILPYGEFDFIQDFVPRMSKDENFSVQIRGSKTSEIKDRITDYFKSAGFTEDKRYPKQIITVFIANATVYAGLSDAEENLSIWSGGMRHFAMRDDTISRAEFKLMEAFETYPIPLKKGSAALDLGAAPGGWTKVLLEHGCKVTAVDSVQLAPSLQANKNVEFFNGRVRDYIKTIRHSDKMFDIIVDDMSMNIESSINFILSLKNRLRDKGYIIITLKLTNDNVLTKINESVKLLSTEYNILHIKQFFHNRSEITVILQKK